MKGFNPTPQFWLQCICTNGDEAWIGSNKGGMATLKLAKAILHRQSQVDYILILDGQCDRTSPEKKHILADVQREPIEGSKPL